MSDASSELPCVHLRLWNVGPKFRNETSTDRGVEFVQSQVQSKGRTLAEHGVKGVDFTTTIIVEGAPSTR